MACFRTSTVEQSVAASVHDYMMRTAIDSGVAGSAAASMHPVCRKLDIGFEKGIGAADRYSHTLTRTVSQWAVPEDCHAMVRVLLEDTRLEQGVPWAAPEPAVPIEMIDMVFHIVTAYGHHHPFNVGVRHWPLMCLNDGGGDKLLLPNLMEGSEGSSPLSSQETNSDIKMRVFESTQGVWRSIVIPCCFRRARTRC